MQNAESLKIAHCTNCGGYTLPANAYGCRICGACQNSLSAVDLPKDPVLVNFITLHAPLSPELTVPCVIGEVEFAPGLIEEAVLDVDSEAGLYEGMLLSPRLSQSKTEQTLWKFAPLEMTRGEKE